MSRRKKGNKGKSSIMLLISFCDFISSAILDFFYFFYLTFPFGPSTSVLRDFKIISVISVLSV